MNVTVTVVCAVVSFITLALALVPIIIGKVRLRRALTPVEYYPPRGFSPIDVLIKYYGFRANTHDLLNAIMLYWADRGFITIEEDCKRGLKLTKLRDLKQARLGLTHYDADTNTLLAQNFNAEKELFDSIFEKDDVFYTLAAKSSHNAVNRKFVDECKSHATDKKSELSKRLSRAVLVFGVFSILVAVITCASASGGGALYATTPFVVISIIGLRFVPYIIHSEGSDNVTMMYVMYPFFAVWGGAPLSVLLAYTPMYVSIPLAFTVLMSAISIIFLSNKIDIREKKELLIYGQINAFKKFLLDVEADRINTLVEENPNYYYNILPYCYILKITKKMKAKFDHVALDGPSWYLGDLRNTLMF